MVSRRRRRGRAGTPGGGPSLAGSAALAALAGAFLAWTPLQAQEGSQPPEALHELVDAERSFARYSVEHGVRPAFLRFLADDGIIFRPRPINGKEWYEDRPNPAGTLDWAPVYAVVSAAGDMGWTTGPWDFASPDDTSVVYGHYVSVWRRRQDGSWRVAIDGGIVHGPGPDPDSVALRGVGRPTSAGRAYTDTRLMLERLIEADRELATSVSREGLAPAFEAIAVPNLRVYRMGILPVIGRQAALDVLTGQPRPLSWEPMSGAVSASHDLGYTFGVAITAPAAADEQNGRASYMRIWSRKSGGEWRLEVDLQIPIPSAEGEG